MLIFNFKKNKEKLGEIFLPDATTEQIVDNF